MVCPRSAITGRCLYALAVICLLIPPAAEAKDDLGVESFIYVGTRTTSAPAQAADTARGIYLFRMRTSDDPNIPEFVTVTPLGLAAEAESPSFLTINAKRRQLFCVNEVRYFRLPINFVIS